MAATELENAARRHDADEAARLLAAGADVHAEKDEALRDACRKGHAPVVELLLKAGADVHAEMDEALRDACRNGHAPVAELLLKAGADVHAENDEALRAACERVCEDAMEWCDYEEEAADSDEALGDDGHMRVVELLVGAGADVRVNNEEALRGACTARHVRMMKLLLTAGADVHVDDDAPLRDACRNGHAPVVELLLKAGADVHAEKDEALREACRNGHAPVVELLLKAGADVHAENDEALRAACERVCEDAMERWNYEEEEASADSDDEALDDGGHMRVVELLVGAGADVRVNNDEALRGACTARHVRMMKLLLTAGAGVHVDDDAPLRDASKAGLADIVELLLSAGADVHADNDAALRAACDGGYADAMELWILRGAPADDDEVPWRMSNQGGHARVVELLLKAGADVHAKDDEPLRAASKSCSTTVVEMLLKAGANVQAAKGAALREACTEGHARVVELLLQAGADVHAEKEDALCSACDGGFPDVVDLLLAAGANPNPWNRWEEAPLPSALYAGFHPNQYVRPRSFDETVDGNEDRPVQDWVCRRGHKEVIQKLLRAGAEVGLLFEGDFFYHPSWPRTGGSPVHLADLLALAVPTTCVGDSAFLLAAVKEGKLSAAERLVAAGADPLACLRLGLQRPDDGGYPYHETLPVTSMLLRADPLSFSDPVDRLQYASAVGKVDVVEHALRAGADVHRDDDLALRLACWAGHTAVVKCLLRAGADIDGFDGDPLEQACGNGHLAVVNLLLAKGAHVRVADQALTKASENGHLAVVERLLAARARLDCYFPAITFAAGCGHLAVVERLLTAGANPNEQNSPLHRAAENGHVAVVRRLLEAGAVIQSYALVETIRKGHLDVVDALLTASNAILLDESSGEPIFTSLMYASRDEMIARVFSAGFCGPEKSWQGASRSGQVPRLIRHVPLATYHGGLPPTGQELWLRHHVPERIRHRLCALLQHVRSRLDRPPPGTEPLGAGTPTRERLIAHLATGGRRFAREYWTEGAPIFFPGAEFGPVPEQFLFERVSE